MSIIAKGSGARAILAAREARPVPRERETEYRPRPTPPSRTLMPTTPRPGEEFRVVCRSTRGEVSWWVQLGTWQGEEWTPRWERKFENEVCCTSWVSLYWATGGGMGLCDVTRWSQ